MTKFLHLPAMRLALLGLFSIAIFALAPMAFTATDALAQAPMDGVKPLEKKVPPFRPKPRNNKGAAQPSAATAMAPIELKPLPPDAVTMDDIRGKLIATPDVVSLPQHQLMVLDMIKKMYGNP
jgi:hypothetical protein